MQILKKHKYYPFSTIFNQLISGVSKDDFCCVPIQGSGTFAVDAAFQTALPKEGAKVVQ